MNWLLPIGFLLLFTKRRPGKFISPVPFKNKGKLNYGTRINPVTGKEEFHNAVDLKASLNTPVKSPWPGRIISVSNDVNAGGGIMAFILHDNGYKTGYMHLNKVLKKKGDQVAAGEMFAFSGNTGKLTTGPHLHFAMWDDQNKNINPSKYFR